MRMLMLGTALAAFLAAGGCATVSPNGTVTVNATTKTVVADIKVACSVAADATAITALVATFPYGTLATTIAGAFCATVNAVPLSTRLGATPAAPNAVRINGVIIPYTRLGVRPKAATSSAAVKPRARP